MDCKEGKTGYRQLLQEGKKLKEPYDSDMSHQMEYNSENETNPDEARKEKYLRNQCCFTGEIQR